MNKNVYRQIGKVIVADEKRVRLINGVKMKFSIIVPVYNSEQFLYRTLDSICLQDYSDFEVICVNDGSTDNSLDVLELYQQKYKNLIIYSQKNAGPSSARNVGISLASGDYMLFCDSDDWFERATILSELYDYIKSYKEEIDVVYFPGNTNWGGNTELSPNFEPRMFDTGKELMNEYCLGGSFLFWGAIYAYAYRLDVVRQHTLSFDERIVYGEDRLWVFNFLEKAQTSIVYPRPCYFYNVREASLMSNLRQTSKKYDDSLKVVDLIWPKVSNRKGYRNVRKHIALFYLASLRASISAGYMPQIRYKLALFYTISSMHNFIKVVVLLTSRKLYKILFI
ncbi:MAG: glycosyltransferase family 2 protein [Paludibacteraceae bacterium]|nr:glycosyltransferase family 2 protein [Paludibacteraceae bacterium]